MKYNGIILSDVHFGAFDPYILKQELENVFIEYLNSMKSIDFIIIDGDYFDHKIYLNDRTSDYALSIMDKIVYYAKIHHCPIRIIYGTESHEVNQYNIFAVYENDYNLDFKIIYTVTEEKLLPDLDVLYIPEEYMYSKSEFYKEYFKNEKKYNYIFGHGVINEVMTMIKRNREEQKEKNQKKVPRFSTAELLKMCKGQVYFGHYHINTNINDKIFYVGSYSRWCFGEEQPKGFYHIQYDTKKEKYSQEFIENTLVKKYTTYTYGYNSAIMESEEKLLQELNQRDKETEYKCSDYVRYVFNIPENHPNPESIINLLNERYKFNDSVKIQVVNGYVEKKKKINKEKLNNVLNEFPMIFDKSVKIEDKIVYFIKKRKNKDIPLEHVKEYLYSNEESSD